MNTHRLLNEIYDSCNAENRQVWAYLSDDNDYIVVYAPWENGEMLSVLLGQADEVKRVVSKIENVHIINSGFYFKNLKNCEMGQYRIEVRPK